MLRCVPEAASVAQLLARAIAAETGGAALRLRATATALAANAPSTREPGNATATAA
jgi:hypothetical protein